MSSSIEASPSPIAETTNSMRGLRNLYYLLFGFAIVWRACSSPLLRRSPRSPLPCW